MSVTVVQHPTPIDDVVISGPYPTYLNTGSTPFNDANLFATGMLTTWNPFSDANANPRDVFTNITVGAGAAVVQAFYKGVQARAMSTAGAGFLNQVMGGLQLMPVTLATGLAGSFANPSWRRVQRFQWAMATSAGATLDDQSGMLLMSSAAAVAFAAWPLVPGAAFNGGFGVTGDGAGNWQWQSYPIGNATPPIVPTETVSLAPFIADAEDWNTFEIVMVSAAGGRNAAMQLRINGNIALQRNWVDAPLLQGLVPGGLGYDLYNYVPIVQAGTGGTFFLGDWTLRLGRFLPGGAEVRT